MMKKYQGYISFSFELESELEEQEAWEKVINLLDKDSDVYTDFHDGEMWEEKINAGVVELVDTRDLKSLGAKAPCRFESGHRYQICTLS